MRVFVYEYLCSAGQPLPESLRTEGWAMLAALLADWVRVGDVEVCTLLNEPLPVPDPVEVVLCPTAAEEESHFRRLAATADHVLVIAPEFDKLLLERCRWVTEAGSHLLGCSTEAIRLTGDKLLLSRHLRSAGVPTPRAWPVQLDGTLPGVSFPAVYKPRFGAGSQATFLLQHSGDWSRMRQKTAREHWQGESLIQAYAPGMATSVAFLIGPAGVFSLLPAAQHLSSDGRFRYLGGRTPLEPELAERAVRLAAQAVQTVPGLLGYVGVDLVLGAPDRIIEINPRLTTSYIGLRALSETNLAEAILKVATGGVPELRWRPGTVRFHANGTLIG